MKFKINGEYAKRHLFVVILMMALGCWFGYDGFVKYPATEADALYNAIEGREAPAHYNLESFKQQKIKTQYGFTFLSLLVSAVVGIRLWKSYRFDFSFDEDGFEHAGRKFSYSGIKSIDRSAWEKKGIIVVDGLKLDSWHHLGVRDFVQKMDAKISGGKA